MDGQNLAKQALDQIPSPAPDAKRIVGLVKEGGRITGYQLSDSSIVEKQQAVDMAKQGLIAGVDIAHRGETEYLKSIPDGSENNNLGSLPCKFRPLSHTCTDIQPRCHGGSATPSRSRATVVRGAVTPLRPVNQALSQ